MTQKHFSRGVFLLLVTCFSLCSCSPGAKSPSADGEKSESGEQAQPAQTQPAHKPNPELEKILDNIEPGITKPAVSEEAPQPAEKPPEKAANTPPVPPEPVKPVKTAGPPEGIDEKELIDSLKNTMILLGRAFESGSIDEVKKFMVVDADLKAILTGGGYSILGTSLEAQNGQAVTQTLKAIKDKKIEHEFVPGQITYTPNYSIFKKQVPTMSKSKLLLKIDGTPVPFILYIKQLVWLGKGWKIFNAEI